MQAARRAGRFGCGGYQRTERAMYRSTRLLTSLLSVGLLAALALLWAGEPTQAGPSSGAGAAVKKKKHLRHDGNQLLADRGLQGRSGKPVLHSHKGHKTHVHLNNGKVTGMSMKTPGGKTLKPKVRRSLASLPSGDGETQFVGLAGTITFTFQTPSFTITFTFSMDAVDPDALSGDDSGDDGV
jgi:hypothetical protein